MTAALARGPTTAAARDATRAAATHLSHDQPPIPRGTQTEARGMETTDDVRGRLRAVEQLAQETRTKLEVFAAVSAQQYATIERQIGALPDQIRGSSDALRSELRIAGAVLGALLIVLLFGAVSGNGFLAMVRRAVGAMFPGGV